METEEIILQQKFEDAVRKSDLPFSEKSLYKDVHGQYPNMYVGYAFEGYRLAAIPLINNIKALKNENTHWRSNHENVVERLRVAETRPDLPSDRFPIFEELKSKIEALKQTFENINPVAYAVFTESGNIQIWSKITSEIADHLILEGREITPLFTQRIVKNIGVEYQYFTREIGESDWKEATYSEFQSAKSSSQIDYKKVEV